MLYLLSTETGGPFDTVAEWENRSHITSIGRKAFRGEPITETFAQIPRVVVYRESLPNLTWLSLGFARLLTGRLKKVIEKYSMGTVQFCQVDAVYDNGVETHAWPEGDAFYVLNPLKIIECVDETRSEFDRKEICDAGVFYVEPKFIYLDDEFENLYDIFRVRGFEYWIVMSERVVDDLRGAGSIGASWIPPEEMTMPPSLFPHLWKGKPRRISK